MGEEGEWRVITELLLLETMTPLSRKFCLDDKCFRKGFVWVFFPFVLFFAVRHTDVWETSAPITGQKNHREKALPRKQLTCTHLGV